MRFTLEISSIILTPVPNHYCIFRVPGGPKSSHTGAYSNPIAMLHALALALVALISCVYTEKLHGSVKANKCLLDGCCLLF